MYNSLKKLVNIAIQISTAFHGVQGSAHTGLWWLALATTQPFLKSLKQFQPSLTFIE